MSKYLHDFYQVVPVFDQEVYGWLKHQLEIQTEGLSGHLDEIWEDVGKNSAWLGGTGENWERGPYYLDGVVPLAFLTHDKALISKVKNWIEAFLSSQDETGFFGPRNNSDWWPRMVVLKVLQEYFYATNDNRVTGFMERYFSYQENHLDKNPLVMWAVARAGENVLSALWLYERNHNKELLSLSEKIFSGALDWAHFFAEFPYKKPMQNYLDWQEFERVCEVYGFLETVNIFDEKESEATDYFKKFHYSHGVNIAMALKYPALRYKLTGKKSFLESIKKGLSDLVLYHGQIHGLYSCDEHLNGKEPTAGVELCTVVEAMFSLETIIRITGDSDFADLLERLAFNALPAAVSSDYTSHQYDQQVNQVLCSVDKRDWYNNTDGSNIFGLEPHFGCCTANMHQGWPKFARSLWFIRDIDGENPTVAVMVYSSSSLRLNIHDKEITINEKTNYPFNEEVEFSFDVPPEGVRFTLLLRIPGWCKTYFIYLNGKKIEMTSKKDILLSRLWCKGDVVLLRFNMPIELHQEPSCNGVYIIKGPLIYALPIPSYWNKIVEIFRAVQLERKYTKDEILQLYLNLVPYGGNIEGVKSASIIYFEKAPNHLSLAELTALSIIPNRPNSLVIGKDNNTIINARNKWLKRFSKANLFDKKQIEDAINEPLKAYRHESPKYFPQYSNRIKRNNPNKPIIATNLDFKKQRKIEKIVKNYINRLYVKNIKNAAVLVIDNRTNNVVSYIGSADFYNKEDAGQVDGVTAIRSPGSTLKPLLYAMGFDKGIITPKFKITDVPVSFSGYEPNNYDNEYHGYVTVEYALINSLNITAVKILNELGNHKFIKTLKKMNFHQIIKDEKKLGLSVVLGGCGVNLEQLTKMYHAFAKKGEFTDLNWCKSDTIKGGFQLISEDRENSPS